MTHPPTPWMPPEPADHKDDTTTQSTTEATTTSPWWAGLPVEPDASDHQLANVVAKARAGGRLDNVQVPWRLLGGILARLAASEVRTFGGSVAREGELDRLRAEVERLHDDNEQHQEQIATYYRASQEWLRVEAAAKALAEEWDAADFGIGQYPEDSAYRIGREIQAQVSADRLRAVLTPERTDWPEGWGVSCARCGREMKPGDVMCCPAPPEGSRAALASVPEPSDSEPAPDADREAGGE